MIDRMRARKLVKPASGATYIVRGAAAMGSAKSQQFGMPSY